MPDRGPSWADFIDDTYDELSAAAPANETHESLSSKIDSEHLKELKAARKFRKKLVPFTQWSVGLVLASAFVVMILYIFSNWRHLEASVLVAFFSAVVVETIGILYIIAVYLFPRDGVKKSRWKPDE